MASVPPPPLTAAERAHLDTLQDALVADGNPNAFERLAADLISALTGLPIVVAKSGYQFGGDSGTAKRHLRELRIECKRYSKSTGLSERELLGEIEQALQRDPALETWILATTQIADDTLRAALTKRGDQSGLPILFLDWSDHDGGLPDFAALCAAHPATIAKHYGGRAEAAARALAHLSARGVDRLKRDLLSWVIGFEQLRTVASQKIASVWKKPEEAFAALAQNAAGGSLPHCLARKSVTVQLDQWWDKDSEVPAAVLGAEGVGKTIAVLHWMVENQARLPIALLVGASELTHDAPGGKAAMLNFLASHLWALTGIRDTTYWSQRLQRLLARPIAEGPCLHLTLDGLNQEPAVTWRSVFQALQVEPFKGRVRVLATCRSAYFQEDLGGLRGALAFPPTAVVVERFDTAPGGELDQILALHNLDRSDLPSELIELVSIPRFFRLVIEAKSNPSLRDDPTVYRLLWEYGRVSPAGAGLSGNDWERWLIKTANQYREELIKKPAHPDQVVSPDLDTDELAESADRADLSRAEVARRLSQIVDGHFLEAVPNKPGSYRLRPKAAALGLAIALLAQLETAPDDKSREEMLAAWLEPIAGIDQATEVLRASVSIAVARGDDVPQTVRVLLLSAWVRSQNRPATHDLDLLALAPAMSTAILGAIDRLRSRVHAAPRELLWRGLRKLPIVDDAGWKVIAEHIRAWCAEIPTSDPMSGDTSKEIPPEVRRLRERLGLSVPGDYDVFGQTLKLTVDKEAQSLCNEIPAFLYGLPLASMSHVFQAVATSQALTLNHSTWKGFKWLFLLNPVDRNESLASIDAVIEKIKRAPAPAAGSPDLRSWIIAMHMFLQGTEVSERTACSLLPDRGFPTYDDYLKDPTRGYYELEFRHIQQVLMSGHPLHMRMRRIEEFIACPDWSAPQSFLDELGTQAAGFPVNSLDSGIGHTIEDHTAEELERLLARFDPAALAAMVRRKLIGLAARPSEQRYWCGIRVPQHLLLVEEPHAQAIKALRSQEAHPDAAQYETYLQDCIFEATSTALTVEDQLELLATMEPEGSAAVRTPFTPALIRQFLAKNQPPGSGAICALLRSLYANPVKLEKDVTDQLLPYRDAPDPQVKVLAFAALSRCAPEAFGAALIGDGWTWSEKNPRGLDELSAFSLILATKTSPFSEVLKRVYPPALLRAVRVRGYRPDEVRAAAMQLADILEAPDEVRPPPAELFVESDGGEDGDKLAIAPRESTEPDKRFDRLFDSAAQAKASSEAVRQALQHLQDTKAAGATLYIATFSTADVKAVFEKAPDQVDRWLEGLEENHVAFQRRIHRAEGLFLALCEVLLAADARRGALLWDRLRDMHVRHRGIHGVDERIELLFRAPENAETLALRDLVLGLTISNSDRDLLDITIAARATGSGGWLANVITADESSSEDWRKKRAIQLRGFACPTSLDRVEWPEGEPLGTSWHAVGATAARWSRTESFAHHWWSRFVNSTTTEEAYAAWQLFEITADRRALLWMSDVATQLEHQGHLGRRKLLHWRANEQELDRAFKRREERLPNLERTLFGTDSPVNWIPAIGRPN